MSERRSDSEVDTTVERLVAVHGEGHASPTAEQWRRFLAEDDGGPVLVAYQVAFHDKAVYPPFSGQPERTGAEAFFHAGAQALAAIEDVGGRPVMGGFVRDLLIDEPDDSWDYVGAARYPSREAMIGLWLDERFVAASVHRRAGTRRHRLFVTRPLDAPPRT